MNSPGIVVISKFLVSNNKNYNDYINYIDRDEAKTIVDISEDKETFDTYFKYMENELKSKNGLFTKNESNLSNNEQKKLKDLFKLAQENKSPMWQDVISFDNEWLKKHGIYDDRLQQLNETKLQYAVRDGMREMLKKENMLDTATWVASIHYNTDNIHVHVATVEPYPTRQKHKNGEYKGKRRQSSLDGLKSKVANKLLDRTRDLEKINDLIRNRIVNSMQDKYLKTMRESKYLLKEIKALLPRDKRQWKYGYNSINEARPYIDKLSKLYIETYHKKDFQELTLDLKRQTKITKEIYGEGVVQSRYMDYEQNAFKDLYKRMGNAILRELREEDKQKNNTYNKLNINIQKQKDTKSYSRKFQHSQLDNAVYKLMYRLQKEYKNYKNQNEFERMTNEEEKEINN